MKKNTYLILALLILVFANFSLLAQKTKKETSIHNAVRRGNIELVKEMVIKNPNLINLKNKDGWTPLFIASWSVNKELVEFLVLSGADVKISASDGYTPLHNIIAGADYSKDAYATMVFLIDKGADVNAKSHEGMTPLHWAARGGKVKIAEFLIANGAKINAITNSGDTPLHLASRNGFKDFIEKIIELGGSTEVFNNVGALCLTETVTNGFLESTKLLIDGEANINICTKLNNRSLLHLASIYGFAEIVEYLIKKGLDVNQLDINNKKPIDYAIQYHHNDIVTLLQNNNSNPELKKVNTANIKAEEAKVIVWRVWGGWAVKIKTNLIILSYWERKQLPTNPCLANGYINPEEIKEMKSYFFVNRYHPQPGGKRIYNLEKELNDITFFQHKIIYNKDVQNTILVGSRETTKIKNLKATSISQPGGLGYFLEIDSIKIFSPFMNEIREPEKNFKNEVDYVASKSGFCDIAFLNVDTKSNNTQKESLEGLYYSIDKLKPKKVFVEIGNEEIRETVINKLKREYPNIEFYGYAFPGDHYILM